MSLVYCNYGARDYRRKPISINTRGYWEFQFSVSGTNRIQKLDSSFPEHGEDDNYWISTPDSVHGWTSRDTDPTEIAVFHFSEVPVSLLESFGEKTTISTRLESQSLETVVNMAREMVPLVYSPDYTSSLRFEICCRQLCLLFLTSSGSHREGRAWGHHNQTVRAAIAWYCAHMYEGIGIHETAQKMGYSVSQLRKIFIKVRGTGPKKVFEECRMNRARELIQNGTMSIIDISMECGYNSQSSFSRAFKEYNGMSPMGFKRLCQSTTYPISADQVMVYERK